MRIVVSSAAATCTQLPGYQDAAAKRRRESNANQVLKRTRSWSRPRVGDLPNQMRVRQVYQRPVVQVFVAVLILVNFVVSAVEAQIRPAANTQASTTFYVFEVFFVTVFALELLVNMYANWFAEFWKSGWNLFDLTIVLVSILSQLFPNLPGVVILRLFRAFRVFRLSRRIESLRKIVEGIVASLSAVSSAFAMLLMLLGIWSIMGVEFFAEVDYERFGTFLRAMLTMWQVLTLDSWMSGVARGLIFEQNYPFASVFFISFIFAAVMVMSNVVVAVLLDKFVNASINEELEMLRENTQIDHEVDSALELALSTPPHDSPTKQIKQLPPETQQLIERLQMLVSKERLELATHTQLREVLTVVESVMPGLSRNDSL